MAEFSTASWYRHVRAQEARAQRKLPRPQRRRKEAAGGEQQARPPQELKMAALESALELQRSLQSQALAQPGAESVEEVPGTQEIAHGAEGTVGGVSGTQEIAEEVPGMGRPV